jgi:hypothetical protein
MAQTDTEGAVGLSVGASIQRGVNRLPSVCFRAGDQSGSSWRTSFRKHARIAQCRLMRTSRIRRHGWSGERRPTEWALASRFRRAENSDTP